MVSGDVVRNLRPDPRAEEAASRKAWKRLAEVEVAIGVGGSRGCRGPRGQIRRSLDENGPEGSGDDRRVEFTLAVNARLAQQRWRMNLQLKRQFAGAAAVGGEKAVRAGLADLHEGEVEQHTGGAGQVEAVLSPLESERGGLQCGSGGGDLHVIAGHHVVDIERIEDGGVAVASDVQEEPLHGRFELHQAEAAQVGGQGGAGNGNRTGGEDGGTARLRASALGLVPGGEAPGGVVPSAGLALECGAGHTDRTGGVYGKE